MISLFIDTSISFPTISLIRDNEVLYEFHEEIKSDMSSKILSIIDEGLKKSNLTLNSINNIFVVTGPGSFTGVRIGVTIAKTIAWSLNKKIIPISSLEFMATTNTNKDYVISMIDARRGNAFAGIYTNTLECIMDDTLTSLEELLKDKSDNYEFVSYDNIENVIKPLPDVIKIIDKHVNDTSVNPHELKPNYLKLTEAEEKRLLND